MGREVGGGFRMGNMCTPMADSCWCMAKPIQYCKVKKKKKFKNKNIKKILYSYMGDFKNIHLKRYGKKNCTFYFFIYSSRGRNFSALFLYFSHKIDKIWLDFSYHERELMINHLLIKLLTPLWVRTTIVNMNVFFGDNQLIVNLCH